MATVLTPHAFNHSTKASSPSVKALKQSTKGSPDSTDCGGSARHCYLAPQSIPPACGLTISTPSAPRWAAILTPRLDELLCLPFALHAFAFMLEMPVL